MPNNIAKLRRKAKLTQQALADLVGAHWTTISRLENEKLDFDWEWQERLAKVFGVDATVLTGGPPKPEARIFIRGGIGQGGTLVEGYENTEYNRVDLPGLFTSSWEIILDDSFYPRWEKGDLIHLSPLRAGDYRQLLGFYVMTWVHPSTMIFGLLALGKKKGHYCVRRPNAPDSPDFEPFFMQYVDAARYQPRLPESFSLTPYPENRPLPDEEI